MLQKTRGIVLHTLRYKDSSLIVDIYTEVSGRASFLVNVSRNRKSSVKSVLFQPLALVEFEADFRANSRLYKMKEAKLLCPFTTLPFDPVKSSIALFLAEFLYRALREEAENAPLFAYLLHAIQWLDMCKRGVANFHIVFLLRLSRFLGLYPNLEGYTQGSYFDLRIAGFVPLAPTEHRDFLSVQEATRLPLLMRMRFDTMHRFHFSRVERLHCLSLLVDYYRYHLPGFPELRSLEVLKDLFDA